MITVITAERWKFQKELRWRKWIAPNVDVKNCTKCKAFYKQKVDFCLKIKQDKNTI